MKRIALLTAVVAALVALGLMWWSGRGTGSEFTRGGERSGAEARDASSPLVDVAEDASVRSPLQASSRDAEQGSPATTAKQHGFEIVVVDALSQAPVSGAEIFVADVPQSDSIRDELHERVHELVPLIEAQGTQHRSDERGRVQLLSRSPHTVVYGRADGRRGMARVHAYMKRQAVLVLHADFEVTVQVVDPNGVPLAGVPVALAFGNERVLQEGEIAITTGTGALATLHHVGLALALNEDGRGFAALAGLFDPPICVALDALHPPSQPVVLVAPASGELEVLARHADGTPDLDSTWVRVQLVRATPEPLEESLSNAWTGVMHEARVVVPRVPLGCRFQAALYRNGSGMPVYGTANGPMRPGERETLVVDSDTPEQAQLIVGRVLDEAGQPIASTPVNLGLCTEEQGTGAFYGVNTDRAGRFSFHVPDQSSGPSPTRVLIAQRSRVPRGGYVSFAQVPLRTGLSPEITDIGDVVLSAGASLVAGRVLDGQGALVSDARVSIAHEGAWTGFWPSSMRARSDAAGRFEVRGMCTAERLFVFAEVEGARSARKEFHPGASDVDLVVEQTGEIAGVIRLTPPLETRELSIQIGRAHV
jgi:protocatechuate 3,4-dioxygenase beta subunit